MQKIFVHYLDSFSLYYYVCFFFLFFFLSNDTKVILHTERTFFIAKCVIVLKTEVMAGYVSTFETNMADF